MKLALFSPAGVHEAPSKMRACLLLRYTGRRMGYATFRFYAELNQFLPEGQRQRAIPYPLNGRTGIKHPIEALGVPHTEVDLLLVDGEAVTFAHRLEAGERVAVYPHFHTLDVSGLVALRPPLPRPIRFLLDVHLGQLATYLRLLGFDAAYNNVGEDEALAAHAAASGRVLLTRDRRLLMRNEVVYGFCLHSRSPEAQLRAVLRRFALYGEIDPWQRCLRCNGRLQPVPKADIVHLLEPKTKRYYDEFHRCEACGQVYWKGSHYPRMRRFIARIVAGGPAGALEEDR